MTQASFFLDLCSLSRNGDPMVVYASCRI